MGFTGDGDLILIRLHEGPPLIQLIVPRDGMELRPPSGLTCVHASCLTDDFILSSVVFPEVSDPNVYVR